MIKTKISINIETENELNVQEIFIIMQNFKARLEGYKTEVPKELKNLNLNIDSNYYVDDVKKNLFNEIKCNE